MKEVLDLENQVLTELKKKFFSLQALGASGQELVEVLDEYRAEYAWNGPTPSRDSLVEEQN